MSDAINWPELFIGVALGSGVQALQNQQKRWRQRQAIPRHLRTRLQECLGSSEQVQHILKALEEARKPRPWSDFNTVTEIRTLVEVALPAPSSPYHSLQLERELVVAIIFEAIQVSAATSQAEGLNHSLEHGEHMAQLAPSLHRVLSDYRERVRHPLRMAGQDISAIAAAAGQPQLKLTYDARGQVSAQDLRLSLNLVGENALRMLAWMQGGVDAPRTLQLTPAQGKIGFTTGHAALEEVLHIQGDPESLILQRPIATMQVRCKITQGPTIKHVDGTLTYDADTQEMVLRLGSEQLNVSFHIHRPLESLPPKMQLSWVIRDDGLVFTGGEVRWLDLLLLILREDTQVAITGYTTSAGEDEKLPEASNLLKVTGVDDIGDVINHLRIHRALARVVQYIEEAGYDPVHLPLPDALSDFDAFVLGQMDQLLQGNYQPSVAGEVATDNPETAALLQEEPVPDRFAQYTRFTVGPYKVVAEQPLKGLVAQIRQRDGITSRFHLTATGDVPRFYVHLANPDTAAEASS
ncbi:hypothetical protein DAETH_32860 (plasmid) [Deinococcus aetherius]|uniref:Uncharacterized protein n=1 Tax=Deinococcus aetherius TaxID=200252 RepID=A0ABM8AHN3_9DEIO|nr:hypothetical protein [Deinococcus aetherius]BDP43317.1 hypothetical protein DAETH_32860 [Deinococcus aetherius]